MADIGACRIIDASLAPLASFSYVYSAIGRGGSVINAVAPGSPAVAATGIGAGAFNYSYSAFTVRCRLMGIGVEPL